MPAPSSEDTPGSPRQEAALPGRGAGSRLTQAGPLRYLLEIHFLSELVRLPLYYRTSTNEKKQTLAVRWGTPRRHNSATTRTVRLTKHHRALTKAPAPRLPAAVRRPSSLGAGANAQKTFLSYEQRGVPVDTRLHIPQLPGVVTISLLEESQRHALCHAGHVKDTQAGKAGTNSATWFFLVVGWGRHRAGQRSARALRRRTC